MGEGLLGVGNRAQAQAHHGLQPLPRPGEVGLAPAEGRQTLKQLVAGRPQPKGEAPDEGREAAVTSRSLLGMGVNLGHGLSPYLAAPLCHRMSSRVCWVAAAKGEAAVSRNSCLGWALCWGCPTAQVSAASTSGGPLAACRVSTFSQISCTVSWKEKACFGHTRLRHLPQAPQIPRPYSHHCKAGSLERGAAPPCQTRPG